MTGALAIDLEVTLSSYVRRSGVTSCAPTRRPFEAWVTRSTRSSRYEGGSRATSKTHRLRPLSSEAGDEAIVRGRWMGRSLVLRDRGVLMETYLGRVSTGASSAQQREGAAAPAVGRVREATAWVVRSGPCRARAAPEACSSASSAARSEQRSSAVSRRLAKALRQALAARGYRTHEPAINVAIPAHASCPGSAAAIAGDLVHDGELSRRQRGPTRPAPRSSTTKPVPRSSSTAAVIGVAVLAHAVGSPEIGGRPRASTAADGRVRPRVRGKPLRCCARPDQ